MTALQLYKFITENEIEWKWVSDLDKGPDVLIFPRITQMEDFHAILSYSILEESGIKCYLKDGYFYLWMDEICEHYDIDINEVFPK